MPGEIVQPGPLNFDQDVDIGVRLSFEPELIFVLVAVDHCWKSPDRNPLCLLVFNGLGTPVFLVTLPGLFGRVFGQSFDGIDLASIKSRDSVVFNKRDSFDGRPIGGDIKAVDSVSHHYNYHKQLK